MSPLVSKKDIFCKCLKWNKEGSVLPSILTFFIPTHSFKNETYYLQNTYFFVTFRILNNFQRSTLSMVTSIVTDRYVLTYHSMTLSTLWRHPTDYVSGQACPRPFDVWAVRETIHFGAKHVEICIPRIFSSLNNQDTQEPKVKLLKNFWGNWIAFRHDLGVVSLQCSAHW